MIYADLAQKFTPARGLGCEVKIGSCIKNHCDHPERPMARKLVIVHLVMTVAVRHTIQPP